MKGRAVFSPFLHVSVATSFAQEVEEIQVEIVSPLKELPLACLRRSVLPMS